ncbi:MAG: hypothetical protein AB1758_20390 [Candidatus Eremiobacterota bacterium]
MTQVTHQKALLQLVADVINGSALPAELEVAVTIEREAMARMEEDFQQTVEELEPEVRAACEEAVEQAFSTFDIYRTGLDLLSTAVATRNTDELFQGGELLRRSGNQLELWFSAVRNQALVAQGPTAIPNLNLFIRTLEAVRDGRVPMLNFQNVVNAERLICLKALDDLTGAPPESEYGAVTRAFDDHLRCMNRLARAIEQSDEAAIDAEMARANKTFTYISELIPLAQLRTRTQGPTKSPQANLVISMAYDVAQGALHQDVLIEQVEVLKKEIAPLQQVMAMAGQVASVLLQDEARKATEAMQGYQDAIKGFEEFLQQRSILSLRGASRALELAANQLYECYEKVQALLEREGKVVCVRCGHFNAPDSRACSKCGAVMPVLVDKAEASSTFSVAAEGEPAGGEEAPVRSTNLERIYNACDRVTLQQISLQEFAAELDWFENLIETEDAALGPPPRTDIESLPESERADARERAEMVAETESLFRGGIADWREALDNFRSYLELKDKRLLDRGKELCDQGARKLVKLALASQATAAARESEQP